MKANCWFIIFAWLSSVHFVKAAIDADLVIHNANIITVDSRFSFAKAMAIRGDRIVALGTDSDILHYAPKTAKIIDAKGKTILPGIYDSHVHSYRASVSELGGGAPIIHSIVEAQAWIRNQARTKASGSWIILERVYASRLKEQRLPTKAELDAAAPDHPVHWNSGPVSIANSKALELSGIKSDTPNPLPGEIVKDPLNGQPTGLLRNAAHLLKGAVSAYKPTMDEQRVALKKLHGMYNRQGITSIGERRTEFEAIDLFRDLAAKGELTVRVNCTRMMEPVPKTVEDAVKKMDEMTTRFVGGNKSTEQYGPTGVGDNWVRMGPLKVLLDGGMLIGTAYMKEPWGTNELYQITDANYRGLLNVKPEILNALYLAAAKQGWRLTAHCTGEGSPGVLLDCYENLAKELGAEAVRNGRHSITHANFLSLENILRCKALNISADIQPAWLFKDGFTLERVLGSRRMKDFQPLKACFDNGIIIGGGSDHMVQSDSLDSTNPWNPWLGMWTVITRLTERGGAVNSNQKLTREQAIRFYTWNNAYLAAEEQIKGSLEAGKLADLIMIDRDILKCPLDEIRKVQVLMTMVGGKIVWQR